MLTTGLGHVAVLTRDLDEFVNFYTRVFEMEVVFEEATPAFRHAILRASACSWLHPVSVPDNPHASGLPQMLARGHIDHLALNVGSLDSLQLVRGRLLDRGATDGKIDDLGAFWSLWFRDPDGMSGEVAWIKDPALRSFHAPTPAQFKD